MEWYYHLLLKTKAQGICYLNKLVNVTAATQVYFKPSTTADLWSVGNPLQTVRAGLVSRMLDMCSYTKTHDRSKKWTAPSLGFHLSQLHKFKMHTLTDFAFQPPFHTPEAKCLCGWSKDICSRVHPADPGHPHRWSRCPDRSCCCRFCYRISRYGKIMPEMAPCRECLGDPLWDHGLTELSVNFNYNKSDLHHLWPKRFARWASH